MLYSTILQKKTNKQNKKETKQKKTTKTIQLCLGWVKVRHIKVLMPSVTASSTLRNFRIRLVHETYKIHFEFFIFKEKTNPVYFTVNIFTILILHKCITIHQEVLWAFKKNQNLLKNWKKKYRKFSAKLRAPRLEHLIDDIKNVHVNWKFAQRNLTYCALEKFFDITFKAFKNVYRRYQYHLYNLRYHGICTFSMNLYKSWVNFSVL